MKVRIQNRFLLTVLAAVPGEQWHYQWEAADSTPNLGPMAQGFIHAVYPGLDDKSITTLEFDGVELAAIQGLNEKVETGSQRSEVRSQRSEERIQQLEAENAELKRENESLDKRVEVLEKFIFNQKSN